MPNRPEQAPWGEWERFSHLEAFFDRRPTPASPDRTARQADPRHTAPSQSPYIGKIYMVNDPRNRRFASAKPSRACYVAIVDSSSRSLTLVLCTSRQPDAQYRNTRLVMNRVPVPGVDFHSGWMRDNSWAVNYCYNYLVDNAEWQDSINNGRCTLQGKQHIGQVTCAQLQEQLSELCQYWP